MFKIYLATFLFFITTQPASAYIDPGVLTFIWQGIVLAITSAYFLFKGVRDKIFEFFVKIKNKFKNEKSDKSR